MNYSRNIRRTQVAKRIIASWVLIAVVFFLIGLFVGHITSYKPTEEQETEKQTVEALTKEVVIYGKYDGQEIEPEIKDIDWEVPNDFEPLDVDMDADLQEFTYCICRAYNLDFTLIMAMIEHESDYQADCISKTDDYGLMQINKCNHEWMTEELGVTDFLDPYQNIIAGCYVMRDLFKRYDNVNRVLMSYNMGEYQASLLWNNGVYKSNYSKAVLKIQERLNQ